MKNIVKIFKKVKIKKLIKAKKIKKAIKKETKKHSKALLKNLLHHETLLTKDMQMKFFEVLIILAFINVKQRLVKMAKTDLLMEYRLLRIFWRRLAIKQG